MRRQRVPQVTVPAFLAAVRAGALPEGPRAELIGGRVVPGARPSPVETGVIAYLMEVLGAAEVKRAGGEPVAGAPFRLGPGDLLRADVALLPTPEGAMRRRSGSAASVIGVGGSFDPTAALVIVELVRGRARAAERAALYAAAGARELWCVDIGRGWTEALRSPWRGTYRSRTLWYPGEALPLGMLGGVEVVTMPAP